MSNANDKNIDIQSGPATTSGVQRNTTQTQTLTPDEALDRAIELHQKGRTTEARVIYNTILKANPAHSGALHFLGILYFQNGNHEEAIELINLALTHDPAYTDARNNLGNIYQSRQMLTEAESSYRQVLAESPDHADANNNLAAVLKARGNYREAATYYKAALTISPDIADFHYNLGNTYSSSQQWQLAEDAYREAIRVDPEYVAAYRELGNVLRALGKQQQALDILSEASRLDEAHAEVHYAYGAALQTSGLFDDAVSAYQRAIEHNASFTQTYPNLIVSLNAQNRLAEAERYVRQWLAQEPDSATASHMLASITGNNVPDRAGDRYIKGLFDTFSDSFDEKLQSLEYQAPELIADKLISAGIIYRENPCDILDVGCGTGLCGPLLREYASVLDGVDLSPGMLAGAKQRNVYDNLIEAELTDYLLADQGSHDLIISADTLVYFGKLDDAINASHSRLKPGGWLAFSIEKLGNTDTSLPYRLNLHGRYSHSKTYVDETLRKSGFIQISISDAILRQEMGVSVHGFIVMARKQINV